MKDRRDYDSEILVKCEQSAIKRAIIKSVQSNSVAGVSSAFLILTPRDDVAGVEEFGDF